MPQPRLTSLIVFSHPNHELAIFGLLQRLRPYLLYLTDGGGENRVAQTRQGLESIGLLDRASFLNYSEKSFYEALLNCDTAFYQEVADQVRASFQALRADQIFCDAMEFYNPVHDISLPIVKAALRGIEAPVFEVPLVYQKPGEGEKYEVQRLPQSRRGEQIEAQLSEQELAAKVNARDQIYTLLTAQMGPIISQLSPSHAACEVVVPAGLSLPEPISDCCLRYERRAQVLMEQGEIERKITYADHFLPMASSLLSNQTRTKEMTQVAG